MTVHGRIWHMDNKEKSSTQPWPKFSYDLISLKWAVEPRKSNVFFAPGCTKAPAVSKIPLNFSVTSSKGSLKIFSGKFDSAEPSTSHHEVAIETLQTAPGKCPQSLWAAPWRRGNPIPPSPPIRISLSSLAKFPDGLQYGQDS